jgi:hypothetical protein
MAGGAMVCRVGRLSWRPSWYSCGVIIPWSYMLCSTRSRRSRARMGNWSGSNPLGDAIMAARRAA